jgi:hypothetical protein
VARPRQAKKTSRADRITLPNANERCIKLENDEFKLAIKQSQQHLSSETSSSRPYNDQILIETRHRRPKYLCTCPSWTPRLLHAFRSVTKNLPLHPQITRIPPAFTILCIESHPLSFWSKLTPLTRPIKFLLASCAPEWHVVKTNLGLNENNKSTAWN